MRREAGGKDEEGGNHKNKSRRFVTLTRNGPGLRREAGGKGEGGGAKEEGNAVDSLFSPGMARDCGVNPGETVNVTV